MKSDILEDYHEVTQKLTASVQPHVPSTDQHHQTTQKDGLEDYRLMQYQTTVEDETDEQWGLLHLVQDWIQQG